LNHVGRHRYASSDQVNELVQRLAPYYTDEQIAFTLNMKHFHTGHGKSFTRARLGQVRCTLELPPADPTRTPETKHATRMSVAQAANVLGVSPDTIRR
jgi:hypothetical protein